MRLAPAAVFAITFSPALALAAEARAVSPQNPYRTVNLSGINYGSMQWEKARRQGKRAGPSSTPASPSGRGLFRRR